MHSTSGLTINKVLYNSSLKISETGQSTLGNYNIVAKVSVRDLDLLSVKACNMDITYDIMFKMLTERWLTFVEKGSMDFMKSVLFQDEVTNFAFERAEEVEDNFVNIYWTLIMRAK